MQDQLNFDASMSARYAAKKVAGVVTSETLTITVGLGAGLSLGGFHENQKQSMGGANLDQLVPTGFRRLLRRTMGLDESSTSDIDSLGRAMLLAIKDLVVKHDSSNTIKFTVAVTNPPNGRRFYQLLKAETMVTEKGGFSAGGEIVAVPGSGVKMILQGGVSRHRAFVHQRYYAATSLTGLTAEFREHDEAGWQAFKEDSKLVDRLVAMINEEAVSERNKVADGGVSLANVTRALDNGVDVERLKELKSGLANDPRKGALYELKKWIVDLTLSGNTDAIDAARDGLAQANGAQNGNDFADVLDAMVRAKHATAGGSKTLVTRHEYTGAQLQDFAFSKIDEARKSIAQQLANKYRLSERFAAEATPAELQEEAAAKLRVARNVGSSAEQDEVLDLLQRSLALERAGELIIDLTEFGDEADKTKALATIVNDLPATLAGDRDNIPLGNFFQARFMRGDDGGLHVEPRVIEGLVSAVRASDTDAALGHLERRMTELGFGADVEIDAFKRPDGGRFDPNVSYSEQARQVHIDDIVQKARKTLLPMEVRDVKDRVTKRYMHRRPSQRFGALFKNWADKNR